MDSNDIFFSLFARDMLGRVYCDSKNGRGIIIACCAEKLCIRYTSGKTELKTLAEMLTDRDRTVTYIKSEELEKLNNQTVTLIFYEAILKATAKQNGCCSKRALTKELSSYLNK